MNSLKVKKGDTVKIIAGKDKGKTGKVTLVLPAENRVVVENANIVTKHRKARAAGEQSSKEKMAAPMDASNVMVVCPSCGKATRVAKKEADGKRVRVCKHCAASLDSKKVKDEKKSAKKGKKAEKAAQETAAAAETEVKTAQAGETKPTAKKTAAKKPAAKKTEEKAEEPKTEEASEIKE